MSQELVTEPLTEEEWLEEYAPDWLRDPDDPPAADMCTQCQAHAIANNLAWPPCGVKKTKRASLNYKLQYDALEDHGALMGLDDEEKLEVQMESDPVSWCMTEFTIDGKPWIPRWYQKIFMRCTATKRAALWGRRSGKSECMIVLALWHAMFRVGIEGKDLPYYIQIFVNSEQLAKKHYDEMFRFINAGRRLSNMVRSQEKGKRIQFKNNVTISFNVISMKQIGQDAHFIWFDEAAFYESDSAFAHASAVKLSRPQTPVVMTSNSSGFRGKFYEFCHQKDTYLLQLPSYVNPDWDIEMELFSRQNYSQFEYDILIKAEWGEASQGIFRPVDINYCLKNFGYTRSDCTRNKRPGVVRVLGNDWNESSNGVHFVIVELDPSYRPEGKPIFKTVHKEVVADNEYNHETALKVAKQLYIGWGCNAAFLDAGGGGSINVERLRLELRKEGRYKEANAVHALNMSEKLPVPDYNGGTVKKYAKNLITNVCQILCESHRLAWPIEESDEDTAIGKARNIIPQMRAYKIARWDASGRAIYESDIEIDHTLTAWMLAVYGCVVNTTGMVADHLPTTSYLIPRESLPSEEKEDKAPEEPSENKVNEEKNRNSFGMPKVNRGGAFRGWNPSGSGNRTGGLNGRGRRTW